MSAKRGFSQNHTLPDNPHWIDFPRSDGSQDSWPKNTTRLVDHENHVNYMRPAPSDEGMCIKWRKDIGAALASRMGLPGGPSYVLRNWPQGYHMYDHNKGPANNPRHDLYLIGSVNVNRFRSIPEFIPHALWLMQDPTMDRANCACKYCSKVPQRQITNLMGLLPKRSTPLSTQSPGPSRVARSREQRERRQAKPYAAVRRVPKPVKQHATPQHYMLPERNNDLRAAYANTDMKLRRWFRRGELLWCALQDPIRGKTEEENIIFWPGIVEETKYRSDPIPQPEADLGATVPWTVRQYTIYKMKLLGVTFTYSLPDDRVLPYQAYGPSSELLNAIQSIPLESLAPNPDRMAAFNPCPAPPTSESDPSGYISNASGLRFIEAAAPYSLAVQIAAFLTGYWQPTDEWDFKCPIPALVQPSVSPPRSTLPAASSSASLQSVIASTMLSNAALHESAGVFAEAMDRTAAPNIGPPQVSQNEAQGMATRGVTNQAQRVMTEVRYQGLWWGAERIWIDDIVRLKVARRQVAPEGAENIYPPASPSKATIAHYSPMADMDGLDPTDPQEFGAGARGLFMKLEGLFLVDVPAEDGQGTKKECRASGMLYELADEDWDDDLIEAAQLAENKAKSKERATQDIDALETTGPAPPQPTLTNDHTATTPPLPTDENVFMSTPSPLKPLLPNPDPSIPINETASATLAETLPPTQPPSQPHTPNAQLSHPKLLSAYPLPTAPAGFKFRPILSPGHEVVVDLTMISGRYYPRLLTHPLLEPIVHQALRLPPEEGGVNSNYHLWALEGLAPGFFNAVDPIKWKATREAMSSDADKEARAGLQAHWAMKAEEKARMEEMTVGMSGAFGAVPQVAGDHVMGDPSVS